MFPSLWNGGQGANGRLVGIGCGEDGQWSRQDGSSGDVEEKDGDGV